MPLIRTRPHLAPFITAVLILAMAAYGPIAQPDGYHHFADQRTVFGIANGWDVLSNLGFLLVGAYGLMQWRQAERSVPGHVAYGWFFGSIALTAAGSAWYHLAPDDTRLIWDRLPIALACGTLLAAELQRAYPDAGWARKCLAPLCCFAVAAVAWWVATGDLRPYLLIQVAPLVLIPALHWQSGAALDRRTAFVMAIVLYVVAKMFELADASALAAFQLISGHTLKHLFAIAAALVLVRQFSKRVAP